MTDKTKPLSSEGLAGASNSQMLEQELAAKNEEITTLQQELETSQAEAIKAQDLAKRIHADSINATNRAKRDIEEGAKSTKKRILSDLLPVIDSLELAITNCEVADHSKSYINGMNLTLNLLMKTLEQYGVETINPEQELFDPERHEAMTLIEQEGTAANTIVEVLQKGYMIKDRLIRPARVVVTKGK
jgi:molecular chaperone GrpE